MISYSHDTSLFIASVVVSFVAAFTGLALTNNISRLPDSQRKALIVMSAFILGGGIWSMHFVAMLAVKIDQPIYYDLLQTLGSALVAILVAGLALLLLHFSRRTPQLLTIAGLILGLGIVAMHFIGMLGMRGVSPSVNAGVVALTVVVAIATGIAAIWAAYGNRSRQNIIAGAAVFGFAVVAVHFTAMHGTRFMPGPPPDSQSVFIGDGTLAVTVTIAVFIICGSFLLAATTFISRPQPVQAFQSASAKPPKDAHSVDIGDDKTPVTPNRQSPAAEALTERIELDTELPGTTQNSLASDSLASENQIDGSQVEGKHAEGRQVASSRNNDSPAKSHSPNPLAAASIETARSDPSVANGEGTDVVDQATAAQHPPEHRTSAKIPFERNKKILFIPGTEVGAIRADGRYTHLYTESGTLFCPWSITEAETRLADTGFFRSHRSYLVNLEHLSGFEKNKDAGVCHFDNLHQLTSVPVSRKRVPDLITLLGI